MLAGIEIFCFAASYTVALALEVSRLFFRASVRVVITIGFAIAGVIAQVLYLVQQALQAEDALPLSSWFHWCLIASLVLALIYVYLALSRPGNTVGIFILPMVLGMVGLAYAFQNASPFPRNEAINRVGMVHGISLLLGTVAALLGFSAGLMYLVQDYRLKHKLPPKPGLRLPSLEWLHTINERALVTSGLLLILGIASGAMLNFYRTIAQPAKALSWNDPVVWFSGMLFVWLAVALLFNLCYRPAREGHKVVYLTLASCVGLALVMGVVLFSQSEHLPQSAAVENAEAAWWFEGRGERGEGNCEVVDLAKDPRGAGSLARSTTTVMPPGGWGRSEAKPPAKRVDSQPLLGAVVGDTFRSGWMHGDNMTPGTRALLVGGAHPTMPAHRRGAA